jgi:hypothetical protein
MNRTIATACLLALMSGEILAQQPAPQPDAANPAPPQMTQPASPKPPRDSAPKKRSAAKKKANTNAEPVVPTPPAAPQLPPTLMNQPPVNPTVTLRNGLLTIDAPNSILSEVLNGVRQATGAVIEGVTPGDRVAVRLGPGAPRQVVAALLQGTPYDYLILGSQQDPDGVTRILLTQGSPSAEPNTLPQPLAPPAPQPPVQEPPTEFFPSDQGVVTDTGTEGEQPEPPRPAMTPPGTPPTDPTQPKTPEQLFREMQPQISDRP